MRSSSNPAFRNLPTGGGYGGYAGFGQPDAGYQQQPPPLTSERPMTIDDVVTKTGITLGVVAVGAVATFVAGLYATGCSKNLGVSALRIWLSLSVSQRARNSN